MQCPIDGATLVMAERSGVEIDYCPQCRGVWLDRGELDKIVERSAGVHAAPQPPRGDAPDGSRRALHRTLDGDQPAAPRPRRRESFLSDLFDF